jgi:hypothetical protein
MPRRSAGRFSRSPKAERATFFSAPSSCSEEASFRRRNPKARRATSEGEPASQRRRRRPPLSPAAARRPLIRNASRAG